MFEQATTVTVSNVPAGRGGGHRGGASKPPCHSNLPAGGGAPRAVRDGQSDADGSYQRVVA